jgi:hypothetical protein
MALHEVQLKGYSVRPENLSLGTYDSYGIEQLHVTLDDTWSGLAIDATFHNTPNDKGVTMLVDADGLVPVPPEACMRASKYATITFRGVQDGVQRISCNLPYVVLDHAQVPGANSTATPSENAQALAQMQALRDGAVDAKSQAEAARDDAARSAVAAKEYETDAGQSATAAKTAQSAAETAKAGAETAQKAAASSASSASTSASTATTQAAAAKSSADAAASSATTAKASEAAAGKSAKEAAASAANLDSAVNTATQKAAAASASAAAAKASESAAASSEAAARKYANSAESAAKTAGEAAAAAAKAKTAAESAQADAAASKSAAANSATQANQSANAAAKSAVAAKTSEDAAAKSAADADRTANSIKDSMTQIAANKEAISQLEEDTTALQQRQNVLVGSETGNPIAVDDAFAAPLCGLTVYGKSTQDGTPTPDAPVPIVSAGDGGSVAVRVTGKNLFYEQEFQNYFINSVGNTVGLAVGNVSCVLKVVTGAKYYVTRKKIGTKFRVAVVDKLPTSGNPVTPSSGINADSKRQAEISATSKYMVIQCEDEAAFSGLMVSLDSSTTYSPYHEQLLTLSTPNGLPGIHVTSGGNYTDQNGQQWICDEIDLERGVKVQRVGKVTPLRASSGWNKLANTEELRIANPFIRAYGRVIMLCNTFKLVPITWNVDTPYIFSYAGEGNNSIAFRLPLGAYSATYFQEHPTTVYGIFPTPIETPLTPAEIAAYKAITAYAPDTVVQASDGAGVKLEYQRDVNIVIKNLDDAIASMTTT